MMKGLLILLIFSVLFICFISSKIVQVNVMSRHCDRTPYKTTVLYTDPVYWPEKLNLTYGQLTGVGMKQCKELGDSLRLRYFDKSSQNRIENISEKFQSLVHKFISTSVHRTIISAWSFSLGLFPKTGPIDDLDKTTALPGKIDPIPIHTSERVNDLILNGFSNCPKIMERTRKAYESKEVLEKEKKHAPVIEKMQKLTGHYDFTFRNISGLWDLIHVQRIHKLLKLDVDDDFMKQIKEVSDDSTFTFLSRKIITYLGGGNWVSDTLKNMETFIEKRKNNQLFLNEKQEQLKKNINEFHHLFKDVDLNAELNEGKDDYFKYIHYSAHDTTIINTITAFNLVEDYPEENRILPPYGSAIVLELHQDDNNADKYFVRFFYKKGYNGEFKQFRFKSIGGGCENDCPFEKYKEITKKDAIPKDYCSECDNLGTSEACAAKRINYLNDGFMFFGMLSTLFAVILGVSVLLFFLLLGISLIGLITLSVIIIIQFVLMRKKSSLLKKYQPMN